VQNDPSAASVAGLTASRPSGCSNGSAAVSTDRLCGDHVANRQFVLNRPLRRPYPSASSLKARTVVVGVQSVAIPLVGDNCTARAHCRELRRLKTLSTNNCTKRTKTSTLSCNVRENDTQHWSGYCSASAEYARYAS